MPSIAAPIFTSMRARSWTCGSEAALRMTVVPSISAAAMSAFSVAITDGSSMKKSHASRLPSGAVRRMSRSSRPRAQRAEGVEVRVQPPPADHVAARRRHDGDAEAGQQRAGGQERGADALGEPRVHVGLRDVGGVERDGVVVAVADLDAEVGQQVQHRLHVADPRDVVEDDLLLREQAARQQRQRRVLVPCGDDRAGQRHPAFDDEFLHGASARPPEGAVAGGRG